MMHHMVVGLAACLAAGAAGAATPVKKKPAAVKVSGTQLFMRIDELNKRLDELLKNQALMSSKAPTLDGAAAAAAAAAHAPAGPAVTPRELAQALHESGVYHARAQKLGLTARVLRGLTITAGGVMAGLGYVQPADGLHQKLPGLDVTWRRYNHLTAYRRYALFTSGVTLAGLGIIVGEFIDWTAYRTEAKAGVALKRPLEALPTPQP